MGEQALVSVVIACYNQARYLVEALDSVFKQTYPRIEVIVVDDGSTDDLAGALAHFAGRSGLQVIHQANQGAASARNRGLAAANGELIQFLDADDWLHPEKVQRQAALLEARQELGLVYSDYYLVLGNDQQLCEQDTVADRCADPDADLFNTWWIQGVFPPCAALVRKAWIVRSEGFNTALHAYEDYELWMRICALGCQSCYLPDRLAYYRQHDGSMTADQERMHAALSAARSELARQFPHKIGPAMDLLDSYYYRLEMRLRGELAALRAENDTLRKPFIQTNG